MKQNKKPSQVSKVIRYIEANGSITQKQASDELGIARLASRINELKKDGYLIKKQMIKVKNRYGEICMVAEYSLAQAN